MTVLPKTKPDAGMISAREMFLKRKHGSVHPDVVADFIPQGRVNIPKLNTADAYGRLTNASSYSEYAWEFLRRNRFYQSFIDEHEKHIFRFEDWGYICSPGGKPSFGIKRIKSYREGFRSHASVQWDGIHTFANQLKTVRPRRQGWLDIEYPSTQVAFIFDINALFGKGTTAIDIQIAMAKKHLHALTVAAGIRISPLGNDPKKPLLRAQLRLADLLSHPKKLSRAADSNKDAQPDWTILLDEPDDDIDEEINSLALSDIADYMLPDFDAKSDKNKSTADESVKTDAVRATKEQRAKKATELARGAWENIYNWRFLRWLQHDDWNHLVPAHVKKLSSIEG